MHIDNKFFEDIEDGVSVAEMEDYIFNVSVPYRESSAFRKALSYIEKTNRELYNELIKLEYEEMT